MNAELAVRRTAARAVLADYDRTKGEADPVDLAVWACRLAGLLGPVLDELDRTDTGGGESR